MRGAAWPYPPDFVIITPASSEPRNAMKRHGDVVLRPAQGEHMGGRPRPRSRGDQVIGPKGGGPRQKRRGAPSRNRVRSFHRRHRKASSLAEPVLHEKLDSRIALRLAAAGNALAGNFDNAQRAMARLRVEAARIATALARPLDIRFVGDVGHPPWHGRDLSSICGNAADPQPHAAGADEMDGPDVARRFQASPRLAPSGDALRFRWSAGTPAGSPRIDCLATIRIAPTLSREGRSRTQKPFPKP
jgi:hypothetical protein